MKKINKNIFVFIVAFLLIIHGMFSTDYFRAMKNSVKELIRNPKGQSVGDRVDTFIDRVDTYSSKKLAYYNDCIDINSVLLRGINTRVVKKTQDTVLRLDDGTLTKVAEEVPDSIFEKCSQNVAKLQKDSDIPLLYVVAPFKGEGDGIPENAKTFAKNNSDRFLAMLKEKGVNTLDLREKMKEQGITTAEMFFKTDHHWEPKGGFWANGEICKKLNEDYGFEYDESSIDLENYNIKTYKNRVLGSLGKMVGTYFSEGGLDDFDLITPKFKTNFTVSYPFKEHITSKGKFENTLIFKKKMDFTQDKYDINPYAAYSGGNNSLQVIENKMADKDDETVLFVRDSFSCPVTPYMSLSCKELHAIDLRTNLTGAQRVKSVSKYAKDIGADYIVIMYYAVISEMYCDFEQ